MWRVTPVSREEMSGTEAAESSASIRRRVIAAREVQSARFASTGIHTNTMMTSAMLRRFCPLTAEARALLDRAMDRLRLSARAYDRIIKVSRTIADLEGEEQIRPQHVSEAITYRSLDREGVGALRYGASDVWADAGTEVSAGGVYGDSVVVNENLPLRCGGLGAVSHERRQQNIS